MSLRLGSFRPVLLGAACAWLIMQSPARAQAQAEGPSASRHHVEALVGIAAAMRTESTTGLHCQGGCPELPPPRNPVPGFGAGFRLGYRFRPVAFFELGVSAELDRSDARTFSAPLMAYYRLATEGRTSVTFGVGGGLTHVRADGESQSVGIARAEIGAAVPVAAHWSISLLAQLTVSARGFRPKEKLFGTEDDNPEWLGLSLGPRYSF